MKFRKTIKQREAIPILSGFKYSALYGGSRSGKTFIIIYSLIVRASKEKSRHAILRANFNAAKRSIWLDTLPKVLRICFPDLPVQWNKTDFYITLPNGSEIWVGGLDTSERAEKILGMEFSTIYFNEASQLDYSSIQIALSRLAEKNQLTKRAWFDFNPPSKSHWSYWLFIKKINPVDEEPLKYPNDYGHIMINPKDNLENIDEEYLKILEAMPEKERDRFLNGLFSNEDDGAAYYAFDSDKHVQEIEKFNAPIMIGMDFNVNPMTAVVFQVVNNKMWVLDEVWLENSDTIKMTSELIKRGYRGATIYPDSTGKNRKTSGKSDFDILKRAGFTIKSVHNPMQRDRVTNLNRLFVSDQIIISYKCKKLRGDLTKVVWKNNKLDEGKEKKLTHISDALGYPAWQIFPMTKILKKSYSEAR